MTFSQGWRQFECEECGCIFKISTRDYRSPSLDTCPVCNGECFPFKCWEDLTLVVDAYKNLKWRNYAESTRDTETSDNESIGY